MSNQMTEVQEGGKLSEWLDRDATVERFDSMLSNTGFSGKDFIARILVSLSVPGLEECTMASKYNAAHKCAVLSLFPDLQHVALIPKNINIGTKERPRWEKQVVVMPQWQGYKTLMERDPQVWEVNPTLVHVKDQFAVVDGIVQHSYEPFGRTFNGFADLKGGYVTVTYRDNRHPVKYHFADAEYIKKCAGCADTDKVWNKWFEQMCLKTVMRSAWSRRVVNFDPILQRRLIELDLIDDETHGNDPLRGEVAQARPMGLPSSTPAKRGDQILERLNQSRAKSAQAESRAEEESLVEGEHGEEGEREAQPDVETAAPSAARPPIDDSKASKAFADFLVMFKAEKTASGLKRLLSHVKKDNNPCKLSPAELEEALLRIDEALAQMEAN